MYCQLLEQTVHKLTNDGAPEQIEHTSVDIGVFGYIPKAYIPSDTRRIEVYRRLATARTQDQIDQVVADITSAYSDPPELVRRLILRARVRAACQTLHIRSIGLREKDIVALSSAPDHARERLAGAPANVRVVEGQLVQTNARTSSGGAMCEIYIRPDAPPNSPVQRAKLLLDWFESGQPARA
jgi:transcription-repair coupling factor (superfamily II helicase)